MKNGTELIKLNKAKQALSEAKSLEEIITIRDVGVAGVAWCKAAKVGLEIVNDAQEIKIRSERKAGEFLKKTKLSKGAAEKKTRLHDATTLSDLSIEKTQSHRWQKEASVPVEDFEKHVADIRKNKGELTTNSVLRLANEIINENTETPPLPVGEYNVIFADPPWRYSGGTTVNREIENQYTTMSLEDIKKLIIPKTDNSVLLLWSTAPMLTNAIEVMLSWGFTYKTCAVWDKEKMGMGYWFRIQHELILLGTCGCFSPPNPENRIRSMFRGNTNKHSKKPDALYVAIETMFPGQKYLELFSRKKFNEKWEVWGNEI